ncbi:MAG: fibronectin type III domain-containing protein [Bacteroidales bacterium]|nr:fibronectin type III domain-containing protein [Bacteroidales bacterium]
MNNILKTLTIILILSLLSCNKKPDLPICINPTDDATNITDSVLVLSWDCSDPNGDKLIFDVFLSESDEGIITEENKIVSATENFSCNIRNLKDNTTYYWQVGATDQGGRFSLNAWQFTTDIIQK